MSDRKSIEEIREEVELDSETLAGPENVSKVREMQEDAKRFIEECENDNDRLLALGKISRYLNRLEHATGATTITVVDYSPDKKFLTLLMIIILYKDKWAFDRKYILKEIDDG